MLAELSASKYKNVKASSLKSSAESALKELTTIENNLGIAKAELSSRSVIPNGVGTVVSTALNFVMNPVQGAFSIGALKRYLSTLQTIAAEISTLQEKWKAYEKILEKIKEEREKDDEHFSQSRYNALIRQRNQMMLTLMQLESKIDIRVRSICA